LHGTKEQFSDGVGYSWIDTLKEVVAKEGMSIINAKNISSATNTYIQEEYYYRSILLSISQ
jgi:asparagine synthase (glutamine-hydrolysing)